MASPRDSYFIISVATFSALAVLHAAGLVVVVKRATYFPLSARSKVATTVLSGLPFIFYIVGILQELPVVPCNVVQWSTFLMYDIFVCVVMFAEVYRTFILSKLAKERAEAADQDSVANKFIFRPRLRSTPFVTCMCMAAFIFCLVAFVSATLFVPEFLEWYPEDNDCTGVGSAKVLALVGYGTFGFLAMSVSLVFYVLFRGLKQVRDGFGLRRDLLLITVVWTPCILLWVGNKMLPDNVRYLPGQVFPGVALFLTFFLTVFRSAWRSRKAVVEKETIPLMASDVKKFATLVLRSADFEMSAPPPAADGASSSPAQTEAAQPKPRSVVANMSREEMSKDFFATIESPARRKGFREFLVSEWSVENLVFLEILITFRQMVLVSFPGLAADEKLMEDSGATPRVEEGTESVDVGHPCVKTALAVEEKFIVSESSHEINVPASVKKKIRTALSNPLTPQGLFQIFDGAEREVITMLRSDKYARYMQSETFLLSMLLSLFVYFLVYSYCSLLHSLTDR